MTDGSALDLVLQLNAKLACCLENLPTQSYLSPQASKTGSREESAGFSSQKAADRFQSHLSQFYDLASQLEQLLLHVENDARLRHPEEQLRYEVELLETEVQRKQALIDKAEEKIKTWKSSLQEVVDRNTNALRDGPPASS